ncbi:putative 5'-3' exonuclease [Gordonia araii NBRC 100433]|uniref:5'-3' exonuclease n=1 Tax=Gordonia araii NBRC 100433 TaxID=1073574 RepID=G7H0L4_9ACTN|nr:5'-3' exonuclease [Gordonia araii]NNG96848.1 5'-3' exonuclease [Gordonia araii NBRC 100433]GAB09389.1 putative 5'-3' exonuclease [Gordonia araii NBRC 100433]
MLLDGASLWFRSFYAIPEKVTSPDGRPVNAVRGFLDTIAALVAKHEPSRLVVCLDFDWRPDFRTELIPSYKAHRVAVEAESESDIDVEEVPDTLTPQVDMILAALRRAGIATAGAHGCEADDVIGTLAFTEAVDPVLVVSGDRDLLQVVADDPVPVRVLYVGQGLAKAALMGPAEVAAKYGLKPDRAGTDYAEMSMLRGDPSDGLPGVPGIGEKTAAKLLVEYGSLDALEKAATTKGSALTPRARTALQESADYLQAARTVVFVKTDAELVEEGDDRLPTAPSDPAGLERLAAELGIESAVGRLATAFKW